MVKGLIEIEDIGNVLFLYGSYHVACFQPHFCGRSFRKHPRDDGAFHIFRKIEFLSDFFNRADDRKSRPKIGRFRQFFFGLSFSEGHIEFHFFCIPDNSKLRGYPGLDAAHDPGKVIRVSYVCVPHPRDKVSGEKPALFRGRTGVHIDYQRPFSVRDLEIFRHPRQYLRVRVLDAHPEPAVFDLSGFNKILDRFLRVVDRYGESDPYAAAASARDPRIDADDFAAQIDQCAA